MRKWIIASISVALPTLALLFVLTAPTDEELIRRALNESAEASREGRSGGVIDHLSRSLTFNGTLVTDRQEIAKYVRMSRPEVKFSHYTPVIDEDHARVVTDVYIKMEFQQLKFDETIQQVEIEFAKESGLRWLFLPGKKWRITSISGPDLASIPGTFP